MATLRERLEIPVAQLRRQVDTAKLGFASTAEVPPLEGTTGQPRGLDAIAFAVDVSAPNYHLYVTGAPGSGRESIVVDYLDKVAPTRPIPPDWIYVHNFAHPDQPIALRMPPGTGCQLVKQMDDLAASARQVIAKALESENFANRRDQIAARLAEQQAALAKEMETFAQVRGIALTTSAGHIAAVPAPQGKPLSDEEFAKLPEGDRRQLEKNGLEVQANIGAGLRQLHQLEAAAQDELHKLTHDVVAFAIDPYFTALRERYSDQPDVLSHLARLRDYVVEHHDDFSPAESATQPGAALLTQQTDDSRLAYFTVNLLVDHCDTTGAPIVVERNPTYYNLLGRIDYRAALGAMVTDFRQIKAGDLHRANGGFLVLHVADILAQPYSWPALKQALVSRKIAVQNLGDQLSPVPTATLRPDPIPLDVKVILIGPADAFATLYALDEDFSGLFQVRAEFAPDMEWTDEHILGYAAFVSRLARERGLLHFDREAIAGLVEYGARLRDDQTKLTSHFIDIDRVVTEADLIARKTGRQLVGGADVEEALRRRRFRSNLVEERIMEAIQDGTLLIDTDGSRVGQLNGLAVLASGDYEFGRPTRISAQVGIGGEPVQSIEREIDLSGPIHSKGVLTLLGYLTGTYAQDRPLTVTGALAFEQSYDEVEGDSASSAELYALLSALSGLPVDQSLAVTGSVNQYGEVQAVGGVTHKIEGFFAVCRARGLTGRQGVMIPASNVRNLMLSDEVAAAVRAGQFHLWAVHTIDEGIELLTGCPAGQRDARGQYPEGSVHGLVAARLEHYATQASLFKNHVSGNGKAAPLQRQVTH